MKNNFNKIFGVKHKIVGPPTPSKPYQKTIGVPFKKSLQLQKCPICGKSLVKRRVFGKFNIVICQDAVEGGLCTFRIRGHVKNQIITNTYKKPTKW